jgi:flagellar protein FliS
MKKEDEQKIKGSNMYGSTAHNIYAQNNIGVESPAKLIAMLYEGVLRFNAQAKKAMKEHDMEKKVYWVNRSISVITELIAVLDMKQEGNIAQYLEGLYNYEIQLLLEASFENEEAKIDECSHVFKELLAAWREATNVA